MAISTKCTSSNLSVAIINENGEIKAISEGTTIITATVKGTNIKDKCTVTVNPTPIENMYFDEYDYKIEIGTSMQLSVKFTPENAGNKNVKWSTSNDIIAPVDNNGIVKGNSLGFATITA